MYRRLPATFILILLIFAGSAPAVAQAVSPLVGSWTLVSYRFLKSDGTVTLPMGTDPVGSLIYDAHGRMSTQIMRKDRPRSAAPIPPQVTPDEAKSAFDGYIAYFGTYTLNEAEHTVVHRVEASLFPNWVATDQKRNYSVEKEGLRLTDNVKLPDGTGFTVELLWKRLD